MVVTKEGQRTRTRGDEERQGTKERGEGRMKEGDGQGK
jgi:hypothetical protein